MTKVFRPSVRKEIFLVLEDGSAFGGFSFGAPLDENVVGEVVFNTGMVGYPESFTDPSYRGQILALTYPLIGNYGVPAEFEEELTSNYESKSVHLKGLVVSEYSEYHHHWSASRGLSDLLEAEGVTGIEGIDTRALVTKLREKGTMAGCLSSTSDAANIIIPSFHPVSETSVKQPVEHNSPGAKKRVGVIDCGCKNTIVRSLVNRGVSVVRVPWNFDVTTLDVDGVLLSNGPGDPTDCAETIDTAKKVLEKGLPTFGICLGNQILALAAGAKTYKLKFGHRSQNQPCHLMGTERCFITSQNHGYAVDESSLPDGWEVWFKNLNDGTNEGIRHSSRPVMSVQFHPEAMPGPVDTGFLFDAFIGML